MGNISDLIKNVVSNNQTIQTFAAKVTEINRETANPLHSADDAYTVNIMRADGAILKNVRLKGSIQDKEEGIIVIPKLGSWVLASVIDGVETRAFISQCAEVERTFIRYKNDQNQYLEINSKTDQLQILFKEKKASEGGTATTTTPEYNKIAELDFNLSSPAPSVTTSFYDENGKEISKNNFNGTQHQTILSTVNGENTAERLKFTLSSNDSTTAEMLFTDADGNEKQKLTLNETGTVVNINDGSTLFTLNDKLAKVAIENGFEALITDTKTSFKKDQLTFEMGEKFKITAGGINLKTELGNFITEVSKIVVVQGTGPNVGQLLGIKSNLNNLLK